jgi:hypothetical protein
MRNKNKKHDEGPHEFKIMLLFTAWGSMVLCLEAGNKVGDAIERVVTLQHGLPLGQWHAVMGTTPREVPVK